MGIQAEIKRISDAKDALKTSIEAKGVQVGDGTIDTYASKVDEITTGGNAPLNSKIAMFSTKRGVVAAGNYVQIVSGADYNINQMDESEYSKLIGTKKFVEQWGMPMAESHVVDTCWVDDSHFLVFYMAYSDDEMGGGDSTYDVQVRYMEMSNNGAISLASDLGSFSIDQSSIFASAHTLSYIGHNKFVLLNSGFGNICYVYSFNTETHSVAFVRELSEIFANSYTHAKGCQANNDTMFIATDQVTGAAGNQTVKFRLNTITTNTDGGIVVTSNDYKTLTETNTGLYFTCAVVGTQNGNALIVRQRQTSSGVSSYQTYYANVTRDGTLVNELNSSPWYISGATNLYNTKLRMIQEDVMAMDNYYARLVYAANGNLSMQGVYNTSIYAINSLDRFADTLYFQYANDSSNGVIFQLIDLVGDEFVYKTSAHVKVSPIEVGGVTFKPILYERGITSRNGVTLFPMSAQISEGEVGNIAGASWVAAVKLNESDDTVELSETNIGGLTKTDCSTTTPGEVYILNNQE